MSPSGDDGAIGLAEAGAFLTARYGRDLSDLAPLGRGQWSTAYAFRRGGEAFVIRFSALDNDFRKDCLAVRYAPNTLPIPSLVEIGAARGGFYAISERAAGTYLDDLDEVEMRAMLPALFAALDAMWLVDCSPSSGYGAWDAAGNAPHGTWREALLIASPTGAEPFDDAWQHLRALSRRLPEERHLIHSDLLNRNVLVADQRITAVIDWGCAMYGDFLYDVAWFCFWAPWYPAWQGIDFCYEAKRHYAAIGLDVPNMTERLRAYQVHIGLDSMAYCAFKGAERWPMLAEVAERTLGIAHKR